MTVRRRRVRHALLVVVVSVGGLLLTGCLRSEMAIAIDGDGSGETSIEVYFDEVELDGAGLNQDDLVNLVETATQSIPDVKVSAVGKTGSRGFRVSIPFDDYSQLTQALTAGEYGGVSTRLFQSFQITEGAEGRWAMNAVVDPVAFRATLAQIPASLSGTTSLVDPSTEFVFSVTLPGKVFNSNASSVDGGTARWEFTNATGVVNFMMTSEPAGITNLQKIVLGIFGLLLVGFTLVFVTAAGSSRKWRVGGRRRQRRGRQRRGRRRRGPDRDPNAQWHPKAPAPGQLGGRDERQLEVLGAVGVAGSAELAPLDGQAVTRLPDLHGPSAPQATDGHGVVAPIASLEHQVAGISTSRLAVQDDVARVAAAPTDQAAAQEVVSQVVSQPPGDAPVVAATLSYTVVTEQPIAYVPGEQQRASVAVPATPPPLPVPQPDATPPAEVAQQQSSSVTVGQTGPPAMPEGFVPVTPTMFPDTHPPGPPPTAAPSPVAGPSPVEPVGEPPVQATVASPPSSPPSTPPPFFGDLPAQPDSPGDDQTRHQA